MLLLLLMPLLPFHSEPRGGICTGKSRDCMNDPTRILIIYMTYI